MWWFSRTRLAALVGMGVLLLPGCADTSERPDPLPAPGEDKPLDPALAGRAVDLMTSAFRTYLLEPAQESEGRFPAYNRWVDSVAMAIETRGSSNGISSEIVIAAQAELDPFRIPNPETKDLETIAGINEQTALASMGPILIRGFRDDPPATRNAAAAYLREHYRIDRK